MKLKLAQYLNRCVTVGHTCVPDSVAAQRGVVVTPLLRAALDRLRQACIRDLNATAEGNEASDVCLVEHRRGSGSPSDGGFALPPSPSSPPSFKSLAPSS